MATQTHHTVANTPVRRTGLPASWIKAAGILRGKKPNPRAELAKARREWEARMRNGMITDPQARLDAWERARGALTKSRMQTVLRQLRIARKEWNRSGR